MSVTGSGYSGLSPGIISDPEAQTGDTVVGTEITVTEAQDMCSEDCGNVCSWVFNRITVSRIVAGGTRVDWYMHSQFRDPLPYTFQLQVGRTGSNNADDWIDVGDPVVNTFYAVDDEKRLHGKGNWTHYRVKVTTTVDTYYSTPEPCAGILSPLDWRRAKEILRKEQLRFRKSGGSEGYLLKRKNYGELCDCRDSQTGELLIPNHERCYGTGYVGGYYDPIPCVYIEYIPTANRTHIDIYRGTVDDISTQARILAVPRVDSYDIWVDKTSDDRWAIHSIKEVATYRGVPLVLMVEMRFIQYSDVIYKLPIDGQL